MRAEDIYKCYVILDGMKSKNLPISMNFVLGQNYKKLHSIAVDIEEKRNQIINEYGDAGTNSDFTVPEEKTEDFNKALRELINTEIDVVLDKVQMDALNRCGEGKYDALSFEETNMIQDFMM